MRELPVLFTALAEDDLDQIEDYIAAHNPAAAARVRTAIVQQSVQLGKTPEQGMALKDPRDEKEIGVRLWPVTRYRNYLVLYRIDPGKDPGFANPQCSPGLDSFLPHVTDMK